MSAVLDHADRVPARAEPASPACSNFGCTGGFADSANPVMRDAQRRWAALPLAGRLEIVRGARHWMAAHTEAFASSLSADLQRSEADTLVTELLPLLEAMRFLERQAAKILQPRKLGGHGRPLWLGGVQAEIYREPLGHILIIGPANFPLFLPGVQAVQALVAGNAVTWKPGAGGARVARLVAHALRENGLPRAVLCVTDDTVEVGKDALTRHPDKVIFTGSFRAGTDILHTLADTAIPSVMELSGADAVLVLPSADLALTAKAIAFGLRLNGAEVCMSPRRLIATAGTLRALRPLLEAELAQVPPVPLKTRTSSLLREFVHEATREGGSLIGQIDPDAQSPLLIENATPGMRIAQNDLFAPVLSLIEAESVLHLADVANDCPYALTAAIFGNEPEARALGAQLRTGTVLINDLIAPTADPRVPFCGRGRSGFGATRGTEGLLEMTVAKTWLVRRRGITRHYAPVGNRDYPLFAGLIGTLHGGSLRQKFRSLQKLVAAGRKR